jgi:peptidoglycan/LPS O-acetylase OafA/YrhL
MVLAPRRRAPDPRRLAWLLVPATLVLTLGPPSDEQSPLLLASVALGAISVAVYGLAILPTNPRVAIAGAVSVSNLGLAVAAINHDTSVPALLLLAAAPVVLAGAITRTRRLQRPAPI